VNNVLLGGIDETMRFTMVSDLLSLRRMQPPSHQFWSTEARGHEAKQPNTIHFSTVGAEH